MEETMKLYSKKASARRRREVALERLENQLKSGLKPFNLKNSGLQDIPPDEVIPREVPLTQKDITRIEKEINTLKSRI